MFGGKQRSEWFASVHAFFVLDVFCPSLLSPLSNNHSGIHLKSVFFFCSFVFCFQYESPTRRKEEKKRKGKQKNRKENQEERHCSPTNLAVLFPWCAPLDSVCVFFSVRFVPSAFFFTNLFFGLCFVLDVYSFMSFCVCFFPGCAWMPIYTSVIYAITFFKNSLLQPS